MSETFDGVIRRENRARCNRSHSWEYHEIILVSEVKRALRSPEQVVCRLHVGSQGSLP